MSFDSPPEWVEIYESLASKFKVTADHILKLNDKERVELINKTEEFREKFVLHVVGERSIKAVSYTHLTLPTKRIV